MQLDHISMYVSIQTPDFLDFYTNYVEVICPDCLIPNVA